MVEKDEFQWQVTNEHGDLMGERRTQGDADALAYMLRRAHPGIVLHVKRVGGIFGGEPGDPVYSCEKGEVGC